MLNGTDKGLFSKMSK
jgi:myosin heavy subunit